MGALTGAIQDDNRLSHPPKHIGYSDCNCNEPFEAGIVLDPFGGTCRTGYVAAMLGRKFVMIEGKQEYIETIAKHNLAESSTGVPVKEQRAGQKALFER